MNFRINLTQFYINFSRQEHQIDVLYVLFNAWDSQVSFYTPFHISFTVPLSKKMKENTYLLLRLESEYEYLLIRTIIRNIRHCCESDTVLPPPLLCISYALKCRKLHKQIVCLTPPNLTSKPGKTNI